jgi:hypothetical protein
MDSIHMADYSAGRLAGDLISTLSPDWPAHLLALYKVLRHWVRRHRPEGLHGVLDDDSTLELVDTKGKLAVFKKRQRVKFLPDYINIFPDHAWGAGQIFADYKCSSGQIIDHCQEADCWNSLFSRRYSKTGAMLPTSTWAHG